MRQVRDEMRRLLRRAGIHRACDQRARRSSLLLRRAILGAAVVLSIAPSTLAQRTQFKPAWNFYSPKDDIQLGKQVEADAERQLPSCNAPKVDAYLAELGRKLITKLPTEGVEYPWAFHCVNDKEINAFALPGGYVFVNRGAIEVSENE